MSKVVSKEKAKGGVTSFVGEITLGDVSIPCAVLPDGTHVLSQRGIFKAFGGGRPGGRQWKKRGHEGDDVMLPVFLTANNLKPFISEELIAASSTPIIYSPEKGSIAHGIEAVRLPEICEVWLNARDKGVLTSAQKHLAVIADMLMRGLARVGIEALIDEATGYQEVRDRLALQKILEKYLTDEWAKWTKTFEEDYYKELFRLRGLPYPPDPSKKSQRPSYIGHWTNDIVYSRLAPGVLDELRSKNPVTEAGRRKRKHHQYFTRDYGHPALKEHLSNIIFMMKGCTSWDDFKRRLNRAKPKQGTTLEIPLDDD